MPRTNNNDYPAAKSVSFSDNVETILIPPLSKRDILVLFYSTGEISAMKEVALMEQAGVVDSVAAEGEDMFKVDIPRPTFRRTSLERVSRTDLSPIRSLASHDEEKTPGAEEEDNKKQPKERARRLPGRTRSSSGPLRTDGRGRGPPRRTRSSMAVVGKPTTLAAMQAAMQSNA